MKQALTLLAVLALVVPTMAGIELFWSTTGISDPGLVYSTALTNFKPALVTATPVTTPLNEGTYDLFLWGKFQADLPDYAQIYGLDLIKSGDAGVAENVAYRHQKTPPGAWLRWDGSQAIALDGVMAAVTAKGIQNYPPGDSNNDLYFTADRSFLIGAAHVTGVNGQSLTYALDATPPGLGIAVRQYEGGPDLPDPEVIPATVTFVPEPASMLLLGLAALLRRR